MKEEESTSEQLESEKAPNDDWGPERHVGITHSVICWFCYLSIATLYARHTRLGKREDTEERNAA